MGEPVTVAALEEEGPFHFTRTTEITQQLQAAKQDLILPAALSKLHKFDCIILDDFVYVKKDSMETGVLFKLISERYECKSIILTCNQPFGEWDNIFQDKMMAVAAIDRLVSGCNFARWTTSTS